MVVVVMVKYNRIMIMRGKVKYSFILKNLLYNTLLLLGISKAPVEILGGNDPKNGDTEQDHTQVRSRGSERSETDNHKLLDQSTTRLTQGVADDINGGLTLGTSLVIERNISHLFARIEERVFGGLGEDVLGSTNKYSSEQRSETNSSQSRSEDIREEDQGKEDDTGDEQDSRGDESSHTPAEFIENPARDKHHGEGNSTGSGGEITHESRVVIRVGELRLDLRLPCDLNQVDGDTVSNDKEGEITDVRGSSQETERFTDRHGLFLLLLALGDGITNLGDDSLVKVSMDSHDDDTTNDNHTHKTLEGETPSIDTSRETSTDLREDLDGTTREDQCNVGTETEKRVELFSLINGGDGVGKTPEKNGDDNGSPQLSHDVEKAVGPVTDNGNRTSETRTHGLEEVLAVFSRVENIAHGVEEEGERSEEGNEGDDAGIEELLRRKSVGQLGVDDGETNSHGQIDPSL